uniref:LOB domain-containing protein n=1 Tax=Oryza barthii TaxID=65489 RepID=A0A0D3GWN7_9ORYZ
MASPSPPTTTTQQACAACAHQGASSCPPNCGLAPYFPADKPKRFWYARLMFGMERILGFSEAEKQGIRPNGSTVISMAAVVYLADARVEDPILGAYGRIRKLQQQLDRLKAERARHSPAPSGNGKPSPS